MPTHTRHLLILDPCVALVPVNRTYTITIPTYVDGRRDKFPLLLYFHGQGSDMSGSAGFNRLGEQKQFVTVSAQGIALKDDPSTRAWSVGTEGDDAVCTPAAKPTIFPSCRLAKKVSQCNWASCYNDVHFVQQLLGQVLEDPRIDRTRVFATGCSNGAMFIDHLAATLPSGTLAAIVPWYGGYMRARVPTPRVLSRTAGMLRTDAKRSLHTPPSESLKDQRSSLS